MQFNLKLFKIMLLVSSCWIVQSYSASSAGYEDLVVIDSDEKPKAPISIGNAVKNRSLRDAFFTQFEGDKRKCLEILVGLSIPKDQTGLTHKEFLEEAVGRGFFVSDLLREILPEAPKDKKESRKRSLIENLLDISKWSAFGASKVTMPIQASAFTDPVPLRAEPSSDLPATLRISPDASTLPLDQQIYLLIVRENLGNVAGAQAAMLRFDELLTLTKQSSVADGNHQRSADLIKLIGVVRGVVPAVSAYLQSVNGQLDAIKPSKEKFVPGTVMGSYWGSSVMEYTDDQLLQIRALQTRQSLALSVFETFFGIATKPATVPAAADFKVDPNPANRLTAAVYALHAALKPVVASQILTVNSNGTIEEPVNAVTAAIHAETVTFLKQIWAFALATKNPGIAEYTAPAADSKEEKAAVSASS